MKTADDLHSRATLRSGVVDEAVAGARAWLEGERAAGTLIGPETLWTEAYHAYLASQEGLGDEETRGAWACIAAALVFDTGQVPLNQRAAAREACELLVEQPALVPSEQARRLQDIADRHNVDPWRIRSLLAPGVGCPWLFPRALWREDVVVQALEAILAPFDWTPGEQPLDFLPGLEAHAPEGSTLRRAVAAVRSLVAAAEREHKDVGVMETHAFVAALAGHGLTQEETDAWNRRLLAIREAVVLQRTFTLYGRAERLVRTADERRDRDPAAAHDLLTRAANIYKRMAVAQMYPERLLERHQHIVRSAEELRIEHGLPDDRPEHVLLISTFQSPGDLQRILLSVGHELMGFAYGKDVRLVVCDDTTGEARGTNEQIYAEASRAGLKISVWTSERRDEFLARLNEEIFPDGSFDVSDLAGRPTPEDKGVPYGRIRNFLRLAGLVERRDNGMDTPIFTWLDHDNELGALVLTRDGLLAKRHVFNYFDQKSGIFADPKVMVGGGGYTNDALEGVEKFWVAWGILHSALGLAQDHAPQDPAVLQPAADITRFRPWDQSDTLERLPREGEDVETMSDQFLLLLNTLVGTFRGKYDNQVQIYHPWTFGYVVPEEERLVEEMRTFAGMPGGNTSLRTEVLASPIPFITVAGRGEDIFHLWQLEGQHGPGSIRLTHTPALHTRKRDGGARRPHGGGGQLVQRADLPRAAIPVGRPAPAVQRRARRRAPGARCGGADRRADRRVAGRGKGEHRGRQRVRPRDRAVPRREPRVLVVGAGGERPPLRGVADDAARAGGGLQRPRAPRGEGRAEAHRARGRQGADGPVRGGLSPLADRRGAPGRHQPGRGRGAGEPGRGGAARVVWFAVAGARVGGGPARLGRTHAGRVVGPVRAARRSAVARSPHVVAAAVPPVRARAGHRRVVARLRGTGVAAAPPVRPPPHAGRRRARVRVDAAVSRRAVRPVLGAVPSLDRTAAPGR
ncbi:MAG: hypothetical protein ACRD12_14620 [Acidimicrobiales bacterium]